jgi:large subunit ribosomal protein L22
MTPPDSPQDPQKGKVDVAEEVEAAAESAEQPEPKGGRAKSTRRKKAEPEADTQTTSSSGTGDAAAEETGVDKAAAEATGDAEVAAEAAETGEAKPKPARRRVPAEAKNPEGTKPEGTKDKAAAAATDKETQEAAEAQPRKRDRRRRPEPGILVRAQAKYVRTSARKARLVCDHIRGKDVIEARAILAYTPRGAAKPWLKLLESAIANAEHNHELVGDDLRIAAVHADEGPTLKRYRPRAMGRATRIRKRTSHLTITLTPKES